MSDERQRGDGEKSDEDKEGQPKEDDPQAAIMQEYEELVRRASLVQVHWVPKTKTSSSFHCGHQPYIYLELMFD